MTDTPDPNKALDHIMELNDDEKARQIELSFIHQTDNQATEDEVFGDANGQPVQL